MATPERESPIDSGGKGTYTFPGLWILRAPDGSHTPVLDPHLGAYSPTGYTLHWAVAEGFWQFMDLDESSLVMSADVIEASCTGLDVALRRVGHAGARGVSAFEVQLPGEALERWMRCQVEHCDLVDDDPDVPIRPRETLEAWVGDGSRMAFALVYTITVNAMATDCFYRTAGAWHPDVLVADDRWIAEHRHQGLAEGEPLDNIEIFEIHPDLAAAFVTVFDCGGPLPASLVSLYEDPHGRSLSWTTLPHELRTLAITASEDGPAYIAPDEDFLNEFFDELENLRQTDRFVAPTEILSLIASCISIPGSSKISTGRLR